MYSVSCPLMLGPIIMAIPQYTKGIGACAQEQGGSAPQIAVEALDDPRDDTPDLLPPPGTWTSSVDTVTEKGTVAGDQSMGGHHGSSARAAGEEGGRGSVIPVDERAAEARAIKAG